jgi:glycosyltransferase involved in cell wall biosynthesis
MRCPCPQLNVIHDLNFVHYPELLPAKYARYWNQHTRALVKKTTRIATVSQFSKKDIEQTFGVSSEKIDVLCNGTNPDWGPIDSAHQAAIRNQYTNGKPYFIFIGSLHPRKNLDRILQAFQQFKKNHPDYHFIIVGAALFHQDAQEAYGNITDAHWLGRRDGDELLTLLAASNGLVMVSLYEGFGIPIIEALQCDVPVLAANNSSMPEIGGDAILYADALNVDDMTHQLGILSRFDTQHQQWHLAKNQILEKYTWEKATDLFWHSIQQTLNSHVAK